MSILTSKVDTHSENYRRNLQHHIALLDGYFQKLERAFSGGGESKQQKHQVNGKLLVRDRIARLIDNDTAFFELSALAALDCYDEEVACAGIITGIGVIQNIECMVIANDATVKAGCYYPLTVKKHLRAQTIAESLNLPCVYLVDSGGANLKLQDQVFPDREHFGRIFFNQARMSAKGIPQIAVVLGSCTAGGAYVPAMSDHVIMVDEQASIYLGGPPLVKAATGEEVDSESLGGAAMHCSVSGVADYLVDNDIDAINKARDLLLYSCGHIERSPSIEFSEPRFNADEILGLVPDDSRMMYDVKEVIARIVDDSAFCEFKSTFAKTIICGFAHISGNKVGIIANNGILFSESALKACHFIQLCNKQKVPLVFLQNITGFAVGEQFERTGIAKHGAKMVAAVACADVPKITVVIGGSYGAGNYGMCGRAYDPEFLFMWPNASISVMGGDVAELVLDQVNAANNKVTQSPVSESIKEQSTPYYSTARLWDDGIISPASTRDVLSRCLALCVNKTMDVTPESVWRM